MRNGAEGGTRTPPSIATATPVKRIEQHEPDDQPASLRGRVPGSRARCAKAERGDTCLGWDDVFGAGAFGALADGERHAIAFAQ